MNYPPGRTPVTTVVIPDSRRAEVVARVRQGVLEQGRQAYWVCTLIDESDVLQCQAAENSASRAGYRLTRVKGWPGAWPVKKQRKTGGDASL